MPAMPLNKPQRSHSTSKLDRYTNSQSLKTDSITKDMKKLSLQNENARVVPKGMAKPHDRKSRLRDISRDRDFGNNINSEAFKAPPVSKSLELHKSVSMNSLTDNDSGNVWKSVNGLQQRGPKNHRKQHRAQSIFHLNLTKVDADVCKKRAQQTFALQQNVMQNMDEQVELELELEKIYCAHEDLLCDSATLLSKSLDQVRDQATQLWLNSRSSAEREQYLSRGCGGVAGNEPSTALRSTKESGNYKNVI